MSAAVDGMDAVDVKETLSGKSLTPQVTTCQVDTAIMTLHTYKIHQSTITDWSISEAFCAQIT